jgi:site-specific recombinase XerD
LTVNDIEEFYAFKQKTCKPITILHFHAYIRKALKMAYLKDLIPSNPADKVVRPKAEQFIANYYNAEEMAKLFECVKGQKAELPILITAYYGLRVLL